MIIIYNFYLPKLVEKSLKEIPFNKSIPFFHICLQHITSQQLFGL